MSDIGMQVGTMKKLGYQQETTPPWDVFNSQCPTRQVLDRIADKWTVLIIRRLADGTLRFSQLRRAISGISQKALTSTLRGLERDGIVHRRLYASVPPRVEYSLTDLGRSLVKLVAGICCWAETNIEKVQEARHAFNASDHSGTVVESIAPSAGAAKSRRKS
jgi:DNA-binding HxlR family transcriptional regulator